tara:strand:+ start:152 stop:316 length:165 start_codon:yes stop_codon:yes gene_type:complete
MQTAVHVDVVILDEKTVSYFRNDRFLCRLIEQKKGPVADATEPWVIAMSVAISR